MRNLTLVFTAIALGCFAASATAQTTVLQEMRECQLIECGEGAYARFRKANYEYELHHLSAGKSARVTLDGGDEFWADDRSQCAAVGGNLVIKGYYLEGKAKALGVFVVEGGIAHRLMDAGGMPFTVKDSGPYTLTYEPVIARNSNWFGADGQVYTLSGRTVSEPIAWPDAKSGPRNSLISWTGSTIIITCNSRASYVLDGVEFKPITREEGAPLLKGERDTLSSWKGKYVVVQSSHSGESVVECLYLEGTVVKPVDLPKDTEHLWLFGGGERVYAIHVDSKNKHSVLKLDGYSAKPYAAARRAGKFGRLFAMDVGDEAHVSESTHATEDRKLWRFVGDTVQDIKVPDKRFVGSGAVFRGVGLFHSSVYEKGSHQEHRLLLVDAKGTAKFVSREGKPMEFSHPPRVAAAADGFYVVAGKPDSLELLFVPKE